MQVKMEAGGKNLVQNSAGVQISGSRKTWSIQICSSHGRTMHEEGLTLNF